LFILKILFTIFTELKEEEGPDKKYILKEEKRKRQKYLDKNSAAFKILVGLF